MENETTTEAAPAEPTRKRPKRCFLGTHTDKYLRGRQRVRCTTCGDVFPCAHACDHFDCQWAREEGLPLEVTEKIT